MLKIVLFITSLFAFKTNYFCSCIPITVKENIKKSDAIFIGKILEVDTINSFSENFLKFKWSTPDSGAYYLSHLVKLEIKKRFKNKSLTDTIVIMTGNGGGDCGFHFELKRDYLIYANEQTYFLIDEIDKFNPQKFQSHKAKYLTTTDCDRTTDKIKPEEKLLSEALIQ